MITIIPREKRHFTDMSWLKTYWLFSFDDYYDPMNMNFGALRVFNDDRIQPHNGFPDHPHSNFEIVTIMLDGVLTHRDNGGHEGVIKAGDVQRMSAGRGIVHSEFNNGDVPVHLYQIWIYPKQYDIQPSYEQKHYDFEERNKLVCLVSPDDTNSIYINSDASIYHCMLDAGNDTNYVIEPTRNVFIYLTSGELNINGQTLRMNDQARISGIPKVKMIPSVNTEFVLIDIAGTR